jgi:poly(ADP-ribose) glycohydrolase
LHIRELIKESLLGQINNTRDLEEAIMSYNPTFQGKWSFGGIHTLINKVFTEDEKSKFINETLPAMISIALELPDLCLRPIPLLAKTMDAEIMLTQRQVASLLANAFFCTFPRRSLRKGEYENYPNINFNTLFSLPMESAKQGKLRCIIHYFERLAKKSMPVFNDADSFPNCTNDSQSLRATSLFIDKF